MQEGDIATIFAGGKEHLSRLVNRMADTEGNSWKMGPFFIKASFIVILMLFSFFIGVTRDWIGVTKEGAVSTSQLYDLKSDFSKHVINEEATYVRKDVVEVRLASIEKEVREGREEVRELKAMLKDHGRLR